MKEKRFSTRRKRRYLVEWIAEEIVCTGFTEDISATGIFVRSAFIPRVGTVLALQLLVPAGGKLKVRGRVVRSHRVPQQMRSVHPSGFAIRLSEAPEEYFQLLASLFNLSFAETG